MKLKWFFIICGMALMSVFLIAALRESEEVPDTMVGRWIASSPEYHNRYLELSKVSIVFGTGEDSLDVNFITGVEKETQEGNALYTITYKSQDNGEGNIHFYWYPVDEEIRLKNKSKLVWKKTAEVF